MLGYGLAQADKLDVAASDSDMALQCWLQSLVLWLVLDCAAESETIWLS